VDDAIDVSKAMNIPFVLIVFILGLVGGQVLSVSFGAGARITFLDVSVIGILLFGSLHLGKKRYIPSLWAPIIGFFGVTLLSLLFTIGSVPTYVVGGGLLYILRWILYAALYWVSASVVIAPSVWLTSLVVSGVTLSSLGLLQFFLYPDLRNLTYLGWDPHYQRLFSTLLDPNFTGIVLSATMIVLISMWKKGKNQIMLTGSILITFIAFILTYSRSSLLAFGAGIFMYGILMQKKALMFGLLTIIVSVVLLLPRTGEGQNIFRTASSFARIGNAERALILIGEKPFFGHGFNILRFVSLERSWIDETDAPSRSGAGLDTSFLFVGATTGVVGMVVYGWLIISLFRMGLTAHFHSKKSRPFFAAYVAVLTAFVVHGVFINSLFYPWVMAWLWIMTGVVEQIVRADK